MYKYENGKSYRGDQNLNITKGAVPAFFTVDTTPLLCHWEHMFGNYANTSDITIDGW